MKAEDIIRSLAAEDIEERVFDRFGGPPTVCKRCSHILPGPHAASCLWAAAKQWVEAANQEPKLLFCGVRDGGDFWHLECRFDDGQKFAAVQVSIEHEELADEIAAYLNTRKEREQAQGLAEIRIRQLGEQLATCEKALAERDARVLVLDKIVWGLVHNAGRCITSGRVERWAAVMNAVGCGSTQAHELCRQHGLDPDELVGRGDLCGGCGVDVCPGCVCEGEDRQHCTREGVCPCAPEDE